VHNNCFTCLVSFSRWPAHQLMFLPSVYHRCPVFIVHGTQDEVVPFRHGQELFLAIPQSWRAKPFWVEGAGHNNIEALLRPSGMFVDKLLEFLDYHVSARRGKIAPPSRVPECTREARREFGEG